jgi:hypothetical protein
LNPQEYFSIVVDPTAAEFFATPGDQRRGYLACAVAYHLVDYLAKAEGISIDGVCQAMRADCADAFDVVQGICHGVKHAGRDRGSFKFAPGSEQLVPQFAFDTLDAGFDQGRWDNPGIAVEHNGNRLYVDACLRAVLKTFARLYPDTLPRSPCRDGQTAWPCLHRTQASTTSPNFPAAEFWAC